MIDWSEIRKQFPATENSVYLNTAAAGPLPRATSETASEYYRLMMNDGDIHWDEWLGVAPERPYKSKLYHIYHWVKADLNRKAEEQDPLPDLVRNAYLLLGMDWLATNRMRLLAKRIPDAVKKRVLERPDAFLVFAECDDATLDKLLSEIGHSSSASDGQGFGSRRGR